MAQERSIQRRYKYDSPHVPQWDDPIGSLAAGMQMYGNDGSNALIAQAIRALQAGADDPLMHLIQSVRVNSTQATYSALLISDYIEHSPTLERDNPRLIPLKDMDRGTRYTVIRDAFTVSEGGEGRREIIDIFRGIPIIGSLFKGKGGPGKGSMSDSGGDAGVGL